MTMHSTPLGAITQTEISGLTLSHWLRRPWKHFWQGQVPWFFFSRNVLHGPPVALASRRGLGVAPGVLISFSSFILLCTVLIPHLFPLVSWLTALSSCSHLGH